MREESAELSSISELCELMSNRKGGEHRRQTEPGGKLNKGHMLKEFRWNFCPGRDILKAGQLVEDSNRSSGHK